MVVLKNIIGCIIIFGFTVFIQNIQPFSDNISEYKLYTGMQKNSKAIFHVNAFSYTFDFPRFYGDVILYAPVKLTNLATVSIVKDNETLYFEDSYLLRAEKEEFSLAYCYLRMLYEYNLVLPVSFSSSDINYDLSEYYNDGISVTAKNFYTNNINEQDKKLFLEAITTQAKRDTIKTADISENCIVEVSNHKTLRYLWGYKKVDNLLYVIDPCVPTISNATIDLKTNEYHVGTELFKVQSVRKKLKFPVVEEEDVNV